MPKAKPPPVPQPARHQGAGMVGAVFRAHERPRQALHLQRVSLTSACGRPILRAAWRMPTCWPRRASSPRKTTCHCTRHGPRSRRRSSPAQFEWKLDLEDVHLNIEGAPHALVGDAGKRLHTGRSRNDRSPPTCACGCAARSICIAGLLTDLQKALVEVAGRNVEVILPGFTHLQVAQPVSFAHHLLAYVEMFARDFDRMQDVRRRTNVLPLGAARWRHHLPAGPRARGAHAGPWRACARTAWTP
jgi:hypothetical protein